MATSITKEEFHLIFDNDQVGSHPMLHEEKEWWKGNKRIGLIIQDKVDHDWSYVALCQADPTGKYQAFEISSSCPTIEEARKNLFAAFEVTLPDGWWS